MWFRWLVHLLVEDELGDAQFHGSSPRDGASPDLLAIFHRTGGAGEVLDEILVAVEGHSGVVPTDCGVIYHDVVVGGPSDV